MLLKELRTLKIGRMLVSIERDCNNEEITGFILDVSDDLLAMSLYTESGSFDGYSVFPVSQIDEVFWGNREHNAIRASISEVQSSLPLKLSSKKFRDLIIEINDLYDSICIYSHHDEKNFDIAKIESHDKEWLKIQTFGPKRTLSRMSKIKRFDSISRIDVDGPYQNKIVELHGTDL